MDAVWAEKRSRMLKAIASEMNVTEEKADYMAVSRMHRDLFPGDDGDHGGAQPHEILDEDLE
jgi:hypothetical protein